MSSKKLGGLDKKLSSKQLNTPDVFGGEKAGVALSLIGGTPSMFSRDVVDQRAGSSGMSSAARDEQTAADAAMQTERDRLQTIQDEATRKQSEIDAKNTLDEEARKKLRESQGSGYAANILAGRQDFGYGGGARRRLSGS